jgi:hypothetical protein
VGHEDASSQGQTGAVRVDQALAGGVTEDDVDRSVQRQLLPERRRSRQRPDESSISVRTSSHALASPLLTKVTPSEWARHHRITQPQTRRKDTVDDVELPVTRLCWKNSPCRSSQMADGFTRAPYLLTSHRPRPLAETSGPFPQDACSGHTDPGDVNSESPKTFGDLVLRGRVHGREESR